MKTHSVFLITFSSLNEMNMESRSSTSAETGKRRILQFASNVFCSINLTPAYGQLFASLLQKV